MQWVDSLPDSQTPSWLGLPNNAEKVLLTNKGIIADYTNVKMQLKSICVELGPERASFRLYVVDKYARDTHMENANF